MTPKNLKKLWQENKLAIHNRQNKSTFEVINLLYDDKELMLTYWNEEAEKLVEVVFWQRLRKLSNIELLYCDGHCEYPDFEFILEPSEVLQIFKR